MRLIEVARDSFAVIVREPSTDTEFMIGVHSLDDKLQALFGSRANGTSNEEHHADPKKRNKQ